MNRYGEHRFPGKLFVVEGIDGSGGVKTSVVTLANLNDLQVELDINESDFSRISLRRRSI